MDLVLIEKLMRLLETSDLQELDVNEGGMRLRLAKKRRDGDTEAVQADEPAAVETPAATVEKQPHRIVAGMAGAFYRAPSPGAAPFVTEGTQVKDGQQLAIIEAMKTFNPVEADTDGILTRILLADGASVSPGTAMFEIEPR